MIEERINKEEVFFFFEKRNKEEVMMDIKLTGQIDEG